MIDVAQDSYVFIVLYPEEDSVGIDTMLRAAANPAAPRPVYVQVPEVRGLEFLSSVGPVSTGLDDWWARTVLPGSQPVYLAMDEAGLEDWIPGTDGSWFIGVDSPEREKLLSSLPAPVFPVLSRDAEVVTEQAMQALSGPNEVHPIFHPSFPYRQAAIRWARALPPLDPLVHGPASQSPHLPLRPRAPARPISYEPETRVAVAPTPVPAEPTRPRPMTELSLRIQSASRRLRGVLQSRTSGASDPSPRLGSTINANRPMVVGFASRKGGVGKTTHAAATAATIGEALDGMPDTAALVDGNITNPDSWALNPPHDSATVRALVSRLSMGQDPPAEQYARTPRLAIYPESRRSEEMYTQAEVDIVAEYLRRRHAFIAVDLPNTLPSLTNGGAGAVAAAWLMHCDAIVLPFNADPRARQGLREYVEVLQDDRQLARIPVIAPYIMSANRAIASDPRVQADIGELRRLGVEVVEVPDDENALLALLRDLPINQASPRLRRAYVELTDRIVTAVIASRCKT